MYRPYSANTSSVMVTQGVVLGCDIIGHPLSGARRNYVVTQGVGWPPVNALARSLAKAEYFDFLES